MTILLARLQDFAYTRGVQFDPTDVQALRALQGASDLARAYTDQTLHRVTDDVVVGSGSNHIVMVLPEAPIVSVSEVTIDGEVLDPALYEVEGRSRIRRLDRWPWPLLQRVSVTYDHGYGLPFAGDDPPEVPADLQMVVMQLASRMIQVPILASTGGGAVKSETIGSYSVAFDSSTTLTTVATEGFTPLELSVLDRYRVEGVA